MQLYVTPIVWFLRCHGCASIQNRVNVPTGLEEFRNKPYVLSCLEVRASQGDPGLLQIPSLLKFPVARVHRQLLGVQLDHRLLENHALRADPGEQQVAGECPTIMVTGMVGNIWNIVGTFGVERLFP